MMRSKKPLTKADSKQSNSTRIATTNITRPKEPLIKLDATQSKKVKTNGANPKESLAKLDTKQPTKGTSTTTKIIPSKEPLVNQASKHPLKGTSTATKMIPPKQPPSNLDAKQPIKVTSSTMNKTQLKESLTKQESKQPMRGKYATATKTRRKHPTTKLDVLGRLNLNPEQVVGEYFKSIQQDAFFVKPPNWDSPGDSIELLLLNAERQFKGLKRLQKESLKDKKRQAAINENRSRKLAENLENLRKRFEKINKYIKECANRIEMAETKTAELTRIQQELREGITYSKCAIAEFTPFEKKLTATLKEYEHYESFLEDVVAARPDAYDSVKDLVERCDALLMTQDHIANVISVKFAEIEEMRQEYIKTTNVAANKMLGLINEMAELDRLYKEASNDCLKWESILANAKNCVAHNELNKELTRDGLRGLYEMLCRRRGIEPVYRRTEVEKEADFIKEEVEILLEVLKELQEKESGAKRTYRGMSHLC